MCPDFGSASWCDYSWDPNSRVFVESTFCLVLCLANNPPFLSMQAWPVPRFPVSGALCFPSLGLLLLPSLARWVHPRHLGDVFCKRCLLPVHPQLPQNWTASCLLIAISSGLEKEAGTHTLGDCRINSLILPLIIFVTSSHHPLCLRPLFPLSVPGIKIMFLPQGLCLPFPSACNAFFPSRSQQNVTHPSCPPRPRTDLLHLPHHTSGWI